MPEFIQNVLDPVQLIGYAGTAFALISYQCKKNKSYFLFQMGCAIAFTVQFFLLSSWAGMLLNLFSVIRGVILAIDNNRKPPAMLVLILLSYFVSCLSATLFFGEKWWIALLLFTAQLTGTLAMWSRNGKVIRLTQLFIGSPLWIVNNVYYFSIGGILCETFNICSVIISFIRFRKTGFDKS